MTDATFLTETEAAEMLNLAKGTLSRWRWSGKGPSYVKFGGAVRYPISGLHRFIDEGDKSNG